MRGSDVLLSCSMGSRISVVCILAVLVLYQVNLKVKHVEYDTFYIPEISGLVDIQEDYLMWFLHQAGMVRIYVKHILQLCHFS